MGLLSYCTMDLDTGQQADATHPRRLAIEACLIEACALRGEEAHEEARAAARGQGLRPGALAAVQCT